jgi:hypothetical protein
MQSNRVDVGRCAKTAIDDLGQIALQVLCKIHVVATNILMAHLVAYDAYHISLRPYECNID